MTTFLKKIFMFVAPVLLVFAVAIWIVFFSAGNTNADAPIKKDLELAVMGDSYMEVSFNDSLVPHSQNFCKSAESYIYTLAKLKYLLKRRPGIKVVAVTFSYHNTSDFIEEFVYGKMAPEYLVKYYPILTVDDKLTVLTKNYKLIGDVNLLKEGFRNYFGNKAHITNDFLGGYGAIPSDKHIQDSVVEKVMNRGYLPNGKKAGISEMNLNYLGKIIALCHEKNIKVLLVSTALSKLARSKVPPEFVAAYRQTIEKYKNDVVVVDMLESDLPDSYFSPDGLHLNVLGTPYTSLTIQKAAL